MSPRRTHPLATQAAVALDVAPFPVASADAPDEVGFANWRDRLRHNLARRSDGRWDPLTRVYTSGS